MKKIAVSLALVLVLLALGATTASARPGTLDPTFGREGRVIRSADFHGKEWSSVRTWVASLPDGRFVLLAGSDLYGFREEGAIGGAFGTGEGPVPAPAGTEFRPAGIAADSLGRVVVAGTVAPAGSSYVGHTDESALVVRYTPEGNLDPSFGQGGVLVTDLGLPPRREPGEAAGPTQVELAGLAIDSQDRIVLTGTDVRAVGPCRGSTGLVYTEAFAARLDAAGGRDTSFGGDGVVPLDDVARVEAPLVGADDGVYLTTPFYGRGPCREPADQRFVGRLLASGAVDPGFGAGGWLTLANNGRTTPVDSALRPDGSLLLASTYIAPSRKRPDGTKVRSHEITVLKRVLPEGKIDRGFGGDGSASLGARGADLVSAQILADAGGRVLLGGTYTKLGRKNGTFFAGRLRADGSRDRSFSQGGLTVTGWGKGAAAVGTSLLLQPNRLVLAGTSRGSHYGAGSGLALAGYRLK